MRNKIGCFYTLNHFSFENIKELKQGLKWNDKMKKENNLI
jgi:hypothetical protein